MKTEFQQYAQKSDRDLLNEFLKRPDGPNAECVNGVLAFRRYRSQKRLNIILIFVALSSAAAAWFSYSLNVHSEKKQNSAIAISPGVDERLKAVELEFARIRKDQKKCLALSSGNEEVALSVSEP